MGCWAHVHARKRGLLRGGTRQMRYQCWQCGSTIIRFHGVPFSVRLKAFLHGERVERATCLGCGAPIEFVVARHPEKARRRSESRRAHRIAAEGAERRGTHRVALRVPVTASSTNDSGECAPGFTSDLSPDGALIRVPTRLPLRVGERMRLAIDARNSTRLDASEELVGIAHVVRVGNPEGPFLSSRPVGLRFDSDLQSQIGKALGNAAGSQ